MTIIHMGPQAIAGVTLILGGTLTLALLALHTLRGGKR